MTTKILSLCLANRMRRTTAILLTLIYLVSTSGIALSNFYCCGKLKETYFFSHHDYGKKCKGNKKASGCCDTKTIYYKVKDNHFPSTEVKAKGGDFTKILFNAFLPLFIFQNASSQTASFTFLHAPPLISKQPVYLSVCNFRIWFIKLFKIADTLKVHRLSVFIK